MVIMDMFNYAITGSKFKKKILNKSEKKYRPTIFNYADKIHAKRKEEISVKNVFSMLDLLFLLIMQQEKLMEWHPSRVTRTRIQVIGVIFSDFLIKGKEI